MALLVLTVPLLVVPQRVDAFALPKLMLAESLGLLSLVFLALGYLTGGWSIDRTQLRRLLLLTLPIGIWVAVGVLGSSHPHQARNAGLDFAIGLACLWGWCLAFDGSRLRRLLDLTLWPGLVVAVLGALQFHHLYQPFQFSAGGDTARLQVTSLAGSASDLASYLAFVCILFQLRCAERFQTEGGRTAWGWALGALICFYTLALTQTLTALAAVVVGSLVVWGRVLPARRRWQVLVGTVAGLVLTVTLVTPLRERIVSKVLRSERGGFNVILTGRLDAWRVATRVLLDHPLGTGHGTFRAEYVPTKLALLKEGEVFYRGHLYPTFSQVHNEVLQVGAEWGWPGLLLLTWALLGLTRRLTRRQIAADDEGVIWALGSCIVLLSLAHFPWHLALTSYPILLLTALILRSEAASCDE
ncbi:MAG: O-antigen ligase family protein [Thermoanaerobaculia bacterium]|nr:O-antigen ligase family protein [Thermoanaerobaculia bacterium]